MSEAVKRVRARANIRWAGLLLVMGGLLVGWAGSSQAEPPWSVEVTGITAGPSDVDLGSMTYADATDALGTARDAGTGVSLPVGPQDLPGVDLSGAELGTDDTARTLVVTGSTGVLGLPARAAVVVDWDDSDDADAAPSVTVAFHAEDISLADLAPSLDAVDVGLGDAWLAVRRDASDTSDVVVGDLPQAGQDFFDDGDDETDDDLAVGEGVALRAVVDRGTPGLGRALTRVGAQSVRLDGTLSTSDDALAGNAPAPTGFALQATLGVTSPSALPGWVSLGDTWSLGLATDGAGELTVGLEGGATIDLGSEVDAEAAVEVTSSAEGLSTVLGLSVDEVDAPFGATWLTLDGLSVEATLGDGDVEGRGSGGLTISKGPVSRTGTIDELTVTGGGDALSVSLDASIDEALSGRTLASLVGGDLSGIPAGLDPTLSGLKLHVERDGSVTPAETMVSATGTATVRLGGSDVGVTALVRRDAAGEVLVAARPSGQLKLSDLLGSMPADPALPELAVNASTADLESASDDLDEPTRAYYAPVLCDGAAECAFDLEIGRGVGVLSTITLPAQLRSALGEIGIDTGKTLILEGQVPAFGSTATSLRIGLPAIASGKVLRSSSLDMDIAKDGQDVEFGLHGSVTLGFARDKATACEATGGVTAGNKCLDEVDFSVAAAVTTTAEQVSFELDGAVVAAADTGWQRAFGLSWLTLYQARIKLGVTAGASTAVDLGFLGQVEVGDTDLTVAAKASVLANPPFVALKGFTAASAAGISMSDLASLYESVSGTTMSQSVKDSLPPVGVRNLFLSFGTETDEDLCIRQGFYLAGDLVLTNGGSGGSTAPSCLPDDAEPADVGGSDGSDPEAPAVSGSCQGDSQCLASILIDVQTGEGNGTPSINAAGYVAGWKAGPLQFDPTLVELSLDDTGGRVYIQGGAKLLDPTQYKSKGDDAQVWASGAITLEVSTRKVLIDANVQLADGALGARVKGRGSLNLTNPNFALKVYLRAAFADDIADGTVAVVNDIGSGVDGAVQDVDALADDMASTFSTNDAEKVYTHLKGALNDLGRTGSVANWQTLVHKIDSVRSDITSANNTLDQWGFGRPIPVNTLLDAALFGVNTPDIDKVRKCTKIKDPITKKKTRTCVTLTPEINIPDIPGLCSNNPFKGSAVCTRRNGKVDPAAVRGQFADPAINAELGESRLDVPGANTTKLVSTFSSVEPTGPAEVTCAASNVSYVEESVGPTIMTVSTMGTEVTVTGPTPDALASGGSASYDTREEARQDTIDALVNGSDDAGCDDEALVAEEPALTMSLSAPIVDEGSVLSATGQAIGGTAGDTVSVAWGDTSTTTATVGNDLTWTATHTYADGAGIDSPTRYTVRASAQGFVGASRGVVVSNAAPSVADLSTQGAVEEGGVATLTGTVVDPGVEDTQAVAVDWGDGSDPGQVTLAGNQLSATHAYADDLGGDAYQVTVTVTDSDGDSSEVVALQQVDNVAPAFDTLSLPPSVEGDLAELVGSVVDQGAADTHTVTVDWGDGTEVEEFAAGSFDEDDALVTDGTFADDHEFPDDGEFTVTVTVTDDDGGSVQREVQHVVDNVAPVVETVETTPIDEGAAATLAGTLSDVGVLDTHTVLVDWGDGSEPQTAELGEDGLSFTDSHAFGDDDPSGTPQDDYAVTVTVTDDDDGRATSTTTQRVRNVAPVILEDSLETSPAVEGSATTVSGAFTDAGVEDTHTVTVDWGDGTSDSSAATDSPVALTQEGGFEASHAYVDDRSGDQPDEYPVAVTVTDDDTGQASGTVAQVVENVAPVVDSLQSSPVVEGGTATLAGAFSDVGVDDTHAVLVDWGDGSEPQTAELGDDGLSFTDAHVFPDDDPTGTASDDYTATVTITDDDTGAVQETVEQTVDNVTPRVTDLVTAAIDESGTARLTGRIVDPGLRDTHTVSVSWADENAPGAEAATVQGRTFSDRHTYADDDPTATPTDAYPVTVTVTDDDTGQSSTQTVQVVNNVAPSGLWVSPLGGLTGDPDGTLFTRDGASEAWAGVVTDPGLLDTLTATIAWGDGEQSTEDLVNDGSSATWGLASEHAWSGPALVEQSVSVADDDRGVSETQTRAVVVTRDAPAKGGGPGWWATQAKKIAEGRRADLTAEELAPYLAIARHVSTTFPELTPLGSPEEAGDVLSPRKDKGPKDKGPKVEKERVKLERELLVALLDFVHGERAWDDQVKVHRGDPAMTFGELVGLADDAVAAGSQRQVEDARHALKRAR